MDFVWDWLPSWVIVVAVIGGIFSPFLLAAWVLAPLDRLARWKKVRYQFMVVDYFSLVLLIQLPLAAKHALLPKPSPTWRSENFWVMDVILCLLASLIWWTGVRTFGQAGIRDTRARAILGLVVLPCAYFGALLSVTLSLIAGDSMTRPVGLCAVMLILIGMFACGRYTRRLAKAQIVDATLVRRTRP